MKEEKNRMKPHTHYGEHLPLWWSLSWCFFSSLIGRWDCPPSALDSARRPALLPMGGMAGGCKPEGCGVSGTGRPCPCDKCWAWSCCCCEKWNTDIEFVRGAEGCPIDPVHQTRLIRSTNASDRSRYQLSQTSWCFKNVHMFGHNTIGKLQAELKDQKKLKKKKKKSNFPVLVKFLFL